MVVNMLSRVAESLYWLSRYVERAENVARFIHVNLHLMLDYPEEVLARQWEPLVTTSGDEKDFFNRYDAATEDNVIRFLTFDKENPNSIVSCLNAARENARMVRDTISSEMWEHLNHVYLDLKKHSRQKKIDDLHGFYTNVKNAGHLFVGLMETTMSHSEGWHFARLGRVMERADKTARILDVRYFMLLPAVEDVDTPFDAILWGALLKSTSAFEMYRKRFHRIYHKNVADFLIFDDYFPRSLNYCINTAKKSLKFIVSDFSEKTSAEYELNKLYEIIKDGNIDQVVNNGLHEFIDIFQFNLNIVGREVHNSFFSMKNEKMVESMSQVQVSSTNE